MADRSTVRLLTAVISAPMVVLALLSVSCRQNPGLGIGDAAPDILLAHSHVTESPLTVAWVIRTEDCLKCQDVDFILRRVQARFPEELQLVIVHVGMSKDTTTVRSFLSDRRVDATLTTVSGREYKRLFGGSSLPGLYLVQERRILWMAPDQSSASDVYAAVEAVAMDELPRDGMGIDTPQQR